MGRKRNIKKEVMQSSLISEDGKREKFTDKSYIMQKVCWSVM